MDERLGEVLVERSLDIARWDARIFDEVLDWVRQNGSLLSSQRLANLVRQDALGARLVGAALTWARAHDGALGPPARGSRAWPPEPLFGGRGWKEPDASFLTFGFERSALTPSFKAERPNVDLPVNLALRLRRLFGLGARAESIRFLLTWPGPHAVVADIARSAAFSKRNVAVALGDLELAAAVRRHREGNRDLYSVDKERWAAFLGEPVGNLPTFADWQPLYTALREIHAWLSDERADELSDSMRASEARQLIRRLRPALERAGVLIVERGIAAEHWPSFVDTVENALSQLVPRSTKAKALNLYVAPLEPKRAVEASRGAVRRARDRSLKTLSKFTQDSE